MAPGHAVLVQQALRDRVEGPGADDLVALRAKIRGKQLLVSIRVEPPMRADLRGQRAREPGVEDVGIGREAAGLIALARLEAGRRRRHRVDGQLLLRSDDRVGEVRPFLGVERIPDGDRHAEEALPADAPIELEILRPVAVADAHRFGVPGDLLALLDQRLLLVEQAHEPLARRHQLERLVALLEELDRVARSARARRRAAACRRSRSRRDRARARRPRARLAHALARELGVGAIRSGCVATRKRVAPERDGGEPPVAAHELAQRRRSSRHQRTSVASPKVQTIRMPVPFSRSTSSLAKIGTDTPKRGSRPAAEQGLIADVIGVSGDPHARGEQLGARGRDHERVGAAVDGELDAMEGPGA